MTINYEWCVGGEFIKIWVNDDKINVYYGITFKNALADLVMDNPKLFGIEHMLEPARR